MKVDGTRDAEVSPSNNTFVRIPTTKEEFGATGTWFLMHCPDRDLAEAFAAHFNERQPTTISGHSDGRLRAIRDAWVEHKSAHTYSPTRVKLADLLDALTEDVCSVMHTHGPCDGTWHKDDADFLDALNE